MIGIRIVKEEVHHCLHLIYHAESLWGSFFISASLHSQTLVTQSMLLWSLSLLFGEYLSLLHISDGEGIEK